MKIRAMRSDDVPKIRTICENSDLKYDPFPLESLESAFVMADENDEPRAMMGAERVAEIILVLDNNWQSPAFRLHVIEQMAIAIRKSLEDNNYRAAYAFFGDDVPKGYDRKLYRMGARKMVARCVKFLRGES
jgi:hypothetical protein